MEKVQLFGMPAEKGRWLLIPLSITILLCLGTVYSWSIFRKPLEKLLNVGATDSLLPFTVLLVVFAILMPITGFCFRHPLLACVFHNLYWESSHFNSLYQFITNNP
ncbi:hypothetical protein PN478_09895 [Dolichospermum circinale CS-534/05]|uniref:hypothetical protein n=1 Tax=Dolichospermum circinale TaxID=109265 RepID=UPI00232B47D0|nr:hypothetical protein [Dolichospermum circinale]MDB9453117.1 hypothetical protein [Dolichospermum circinale CS-541/06]MDB9464546.1 hypothetical protein [Dolichospermum circinale CS-541/04]MDB9490832.1 hypothetical protein [Dolichospermum circinale CS-534/05]MDB9546390.1 hypothetical protein [Dolichospermum circinale CS-1031]